MMVSFHLVKQNQQKKPPAMLPTIPPAKPGKNPIDRKTGKRMECRKCHSVDHFERQCPCVTKSVNMVETHNEYFVQEESDSMEELDITL